MRRMFKQCRVLGYVYSNIKRPNPTFDLIGTENWDLNNNYAGMLIFKNISIPQTIHVGQDLTAQQMWSNLEAIYEVTSHTMIINYIHTLFKCNAGEGDNIVKHLNTLKTTWEHVNTLSTEEFKTLDLFFKIIISSSLPPSWDNFTQAYIAKVCRYSTQNPFKDITSQEFIRVIKSEVEWCGKLNKSKNSNITNAQGKKKEKPSLFKHIGNRIKGMKIKDADNENTEPKGLSASIAGNMAMQPMTVFCGIKKNVLIAGKFNHLLADCYYKDKPKEQNKKDKAKENPFKHSRTKEVNAANSNHSYATIKEVEEVTLGGITFNTSKCGQFFNFDNENVTNSSINDEHTLYYDWLADSATTSHITNQRDTFMTYEPIQNTPITGVRGLQAQAEGHSNVNIITSYNSTSYPI
jgi:hypothetical protein